MWGPVLGVNMKPLGISQVCIPIRTKLYNSLPLLNSNSTISLKLKMTRLENVCLVIVLITRIRVPFKEQRALKSHGYAL